MCHCQMIALMASLENGILVSSSRRTRKRRFSNNAVHPLSTAAYFSQTTLDSLGTIDSIPGVGDVHVPEGWFRSARASKSKRADQHSGDELVGTPQDPWGLGLHPVSISQFPADGNSSGVPLRDSPTARRGPPQHQLAAMSYPSLSPHQPYDPHPLRLHEPLSHRGVPPPRLPSLTDSGLQSFRDPSPYTQSYSSSSSSDPGHSPRPFSSPLSPPPMQSMPKREPSIPSAIGPRDLVPLDYLTSIQRPRRDPVDELFIRRLATSSIGTPPEQQPQTWKSERAYDEDTKPNIAVAAGW